MDSQIHHIIQSNIRYLNHATNTTIFNKPNLATTSFAIDDAIATTVGDDIAPPTFRIWVHEKAVVLGVPDSRLPFFEDGVSHMKSLGYNVVIRNSGGLAVALDSGVLNISMVLPNNQGISIYNGYDIMVDFIRLLLKDFTSEIKAYEIVGSYCPGDYDLSINGVKFAGISQRRVRNGVAVQIYLDIEGNSKQRANLIKEFYHLGKQNEQTKLVYPEVNPAVMGSLNELLNADFTVPGFIAHIEKVLQQNNLGGISYNLISEEEPIFLKRLEQMEKRNEAVKSIT